MSAHNLFVHFLLLSITVILSACGGGSNVVSNSTDGILSIEKVVVPAAAGGQGSISIQLIAPTGGPGSGKVTVTSADSTLLTFTSANQTITGDAVFYFTTKEVATDTVVPVTVSVGALSLTKEITIAGSGSIAAVANPQVNSIAFASAAPTTIALKGTGGAGRTETSLVTFIVKDATGQPSTGQTVDFKLNTSVGGITLVPASAVSDSAGMVKTIVNAGVVPTPVRVTAAVRGTAISSMSDQLIISTGLPHQDGLSVSADIANPEAWSYDGVEVPIHVMLADHYGNPVPDGTAVKFMVYGGSIEPSAVTANGKASVTWRSQDPRPSDGIARVMVYAIGEESFTDLNGNGVADAGEFTDLSEAFLSKSLTMGASGQLVWNPLYDPYIDFNGDGAFNSGDEKFNGVLQGNVYQGAPRSLHIFKNYSIVMSGSKAVIYTDSLSVVQNSSTKVTVIIADVNRNPLPKGTSIAFTSTAGGCSVTTGGGFEITPASITADGTGTQTSFSTTLKTSCSSAGKGDLVVTVTSPKGIEQSKTIPVTY